MSGTYTLPPKDLGVRLLSRTTRSVAPTEAGEQLLARLRPAITDVQDALDQHGFLNGAMQNNATAKKGNCNAGAWDR